MPAGLFMSVGFVVCVCVCVECRCGRLCSKRGQEARGGGAKAWRGRRRGGQEWSEAPLCSTRKAKNAAPHPNTSAQSRATGSTTGGKLPT